MGNHPTAASGEGASLSEPGRQPNDSRLALSAIPFVLRRSIPWDYLPPHLGWGFDWAYDSKAKLGLSSESVSISAWR